MSDFIAGGVVGIVQILVGHPFDTIKVLIQNSKPTKLPILRYYNGAAYPFMCSFVYNAIVFPTQDRMSNKSHYIAGSIGGLIVSPVTHVFDVAKVKRQTNKPLNVRILLKNKGLTASYARETLAMSVYFGTYHDLRPHTNALIAGGIAGSLSWLFTYPIDVVRSRQMSQNINIRDAIAQKHLWRGFKMCIVRAFLVNSISFYTYELIKK